MVVSIRARALDLAADEEVLIVELALLEEDRVLVRVLKRADQVGADVLARRLAVEDVVARDVASNVLLTDWPGSEAPPKVNLTSTSNSHFRGEAT